MHPRSLRLFLGLALGVACARADVTLAPLFQDHAVLQCDRAVPVWGSAKAGEHVRVAFAGQTVGTTTGSDGRWIVLLGPLAANPAGSDLVATGATTATAHDVVVGEVWLCSGQSNMEFTVDDPFRVGFNVLNAAEEVRAANYPLIRQFTVARLAAPAPAPVTAGSWAPCSPATVPTFTAVGYFFARDLHQRLGVPVGVIKSTWGGTGIEAWLSPMAAARLRAAASAGGGEPSRRNCGCAPRPPRSALVGRPQGHGRPG